MSLVEESADSNQSMTNAYNLLREACGISQAEAAEFVHQTRLDSVKSWCTDRRTAPQGVINDLQKLAREIQSAGVSYAALLKTISKGDVYIIGLPGDERDAPVSYTHLDVYKRQALHEGQGDASSQTQNS